jgi:GNAT superfamily N-acetyltransferase
LFERDGVIASLCQAVPERAVLNSATYDTVPDLTDSLEELTGAYDAAGVAASAVWVPWPDSPRLRSVLLRTGHRLLGTDVGMAMYLDELRAPSAAEPDWSEGWAPEAIGELHDTVYPTTAGAFVSGHELLSDAVHAYVARVDDAPAAFVIVFDNDTDCVFWYAGTSESARRRGLCSWLLHHALVDAHGRGCVTTTCQATPMGEPVYARLGYRSLCGLHFWERRAAKPAPA